MAKEKKPKTNFELVKKTLNPDAPDAEYLMNTQLTCHSKRAQAAMKYFGECSPCAFCWKAHAPGVETGHQCFHFSAPLNDCRKNIIRWLDLDIKRKVPRAWVKEAKCEQKESK